jgi:CBS domain-containing protein
MLTASAIMNDNVVTIHQDASIQDAIDLLLNNQISGLPVINDAGKLVGIVTEFALLAIAYDKNVSQDTVAQHMTTQLLSVGPEDPINKAVDLCLVHRVRRLPVVEQGRLLGLIARRDLLRSLQDSQAPVCTS